ncbi:sialate O-acetylesterase [Flagellimonas halotolerans]|uniref:Sialate O-acetylesterase n=1 Tax=Flagellimonas halotolerans TaxID=3112164 RepID=A0ABU6IUJ8_9FLAO|nr:MULTISPECIES: sialate O-acetylesterase [unclassified Allomuricauda]MEC3966950.1 sialate O-acetylesterase [Muricauda sp. SYSU M86414]MEC4266813.1 sialate O-acetylesterase [Muricauda sp. SYSU M84420]
MPQLLQNLKKVKVAFTLCMLPIGLLAQLSLSPFFGNHMVVQRNRPIHFWGKGQPQTTVVLKLGNTTKETTVEKDSTWSLYLKRHKASSEPMGLLIVNGGKRIEINNIMVGDVWLCIGQSNMEWPMEREMYFKNANGFAGDSLLRFYNPTYAGKNIYNKIFVDSIASQLTPEGFYRGNWQECDSTSVNTMSAVGYYFGKTIMDTEAVPIGLIHLAIGGAPIETFIDRKSFLRNPRFKNKVKGNWLDNDELPVWVRERGRQNVGGAKNVPQDNLGPNHAFKPGFAYEAGVRPLMKMPIRGIVWYQGESNAQELDRVEEYGELQEMMVKAYRRQWKDPDMPFLWAQLSSIDTVHYKSRFWPEFRNEQRKLLDRIQNSGMAVTSDIGARHDVHPINKKAVGERLARWALSTVYGHDEVPSGPLPKKAKYKNGNIIVTFRYGKGLTTSDGEAPRGFSLDGKSPILAFIDERDRIVIPSPQKPKKLYYAWKPWTDANLVNAGQLPASTFKVSVK